MFWRHKTRKSHIWLTADERGDERESGDLFEEADTQTDAQTASAILPATRELQMQSGDLPHIRESFESEQIVGRQSAAERNDSYIPMQSEWNAWAETENASAEQQTKQNMFDERATQEQPSSENAENTENVGNAPNVVELFPEEEHEARDEKKHKYLIRRIWAAALALMIIATLAFGFFMFRVNVIEVSGNQTIPTQTIIETTGIEYGAHLLLLSCSAGESRLYENPYIAKAEITCLYPDTVSIRVSERHEAAVIIGLNTAAIIDEDGYVLSISERNSYPELLKIYGAGASGYQVNGHIGDLADYSSRALSLLIAAVKSSGIQSMIESADISNSLNLTMLTRSGITVNMGQAEDLEIKMHKLAIVLPEVEKMGYTDGTILVYSHGSPVYTPFVTPDLESEEEADDENEYTYVPSDTGSTPAPDASVDPSPGITPTPQISPGDSDSAE